MPSADSHRFQARYAQFDAIRAYLAAAVPGLQPAARERLVLMVEELFCNSIEHGYRGESDQPVWVDLACEATACRITYEDCAPAYDPFSQQRDPLLLAAEADDLPVGGLGVFLMVALSAGHRYQRRGDRNVIELVVPLS